MAAGVRIIAVTSRPSDFRTLFPAFGRRAGVRLALGLHPLEAGRLDLERELRLFAAYQAHTSYIGEVGLDFSKEGRPSAQAQELAFAEILATAGVAEKVLTIHSRGAAQRTITLLREAGARRGILHWFTGSLSEAEEALDAGLFFSLNPMMLRSKKGKTLVEQLPSDRVLAESDGPFGRISGRFAEPSDVLDVHAYLARHWKLDESAVSARLAANLSTLCAGLPSL